MNLVLPKSLCLFLNSRSRRSILFSFFSLFFSGKLARRFKECLHFLSSSSLKTHLFELYLVGAIPLIVSSMRAIWLQRLAWKLADACYLCAFLWMVYTTIFRFYLSNSNASLANRSKVLPYLYDNQTKRCVTLATSLRSCLEWIGPAKEGNSDCWLFTPQQLFAFLHG